MAEHKISGSDVGLFIGTAPGVYNTVVCLTASSVNRTTAIIDAASNCGPDSLPGAKTNGVTFEGQILADPDSGKISIDDLDDYWRNTPRIYWKVGKLVPLDGDITYTGEGFISELNESNATDAVSTFTGTIGVYGLIQKTTATS